MRFRTIVAACVLGAVPAIVPAVPAGAATPSCGTGCVNVYSENFGDASHPGFVMDVYKQAQKVGQPVILFRASDTDPAEDWTVSQQGTVSQFRGLDLVSAQVALHYGCISTKKHPCSGTDDQAYEIEYAPFGADTGLCAGVGASSAKVVLDPCGVSAATVWIVDTVDAKITASGIPLINGTDTNFSHPEVLTYPSGSYPTDSPRPQLLVSDITGAAAGNGGPVLGTVDDSQLWSAMFGKLL